MLKDDLFSLPDSIDRVAGNRDRPPVEEIGDRNRNVVAPAGGHEVDRLGGPEFPALLRDHVGDRGHVAGVFAEDDAVRIFSRTDDQRNPEQIETAGLAGNVGDSGAGRGDPLAVEFGGVGALHRGTSRKQERRAGQSSEECDLFLHFQIPLLMVVNRETASGAPHRLRSGMVSLCEIVFKLTIYRFRRNCKKFPGEFFPNKNGLSAVRELISSATPLPKGAPDAGLRVHHRSILRRTRADFRLRRRPVRRSRPPRRAW
ncbi:hypothetical protein SDC9_127111 [bioreactor metagenome]|uniref:Uncharacterized protein n=1 Tax=bioreactor metagenome TaxID=1076179 RepID=A0A645CSH8_9ZZZZ